MNDATPAQAPLDGFESIPTGTRGQRGRSATPSVTLNKGGAMSINTTGADLFGPLRWVKVLYNPKTCQLGFQPADEGAEGAVELKSPSDSTWSGLRFAGTAFARHYNVPAGTRWKLRNNGIILIGDLSE